MTAGHCVYDAFLADGFARNWMFIPAKSGASEPFGRWTARRLATTSQWVNSTQDSNPDNDNVRYDVGFATMKARNGKKLQNVVGARGLAFNVSRDRRFKAFGYPAPSPFPDDRSFPGDEGFICDSAGEGGDSNLGGSPKPTRIDCDMTPGSSGGGWVIGGGRVNSVTSYGYDCQREPIFLSCVTADPDGDKLYGPYFGTVIQDLYRSERRRRRG